MIIYEPRRNRRRKRSFGWPLLLLVLLGAGVYYVLANPVAPSIVPPVAVVPAPPPSATSAPPAQPAAPESALPPAIATEPVPATRRVPPKPEPEPVKEEPLKLAQVAIVTEQNVRYLSGSITDQTGTYYQYVSVKFVLFDANGNRLSELFLSNGNSNQRLDPYGTWRFKAVLADPRVATYELLEVSGH